MARISKFKKQHILAYNSWRSMLDRCNNPSHKSYKDYGGKDIKYDLAWEKFETFLIDMGDPPIDKDTGRRYTLDRKDNTKGYSKANCRWATDIEQNANRTSKYRCMLANEL